MIKNYFCNKIMYIDDLKKLIKDVEKSIHGDQRWIENEDFKLKSKLKRLVKDKNQDVKSYFNSNEYVEYIPEFIPNQFKEKK